MQEALGQSAPFVAHGLLALFGAIVHASKSYRDGKSKTWIDHVLLLIMSSFSGVIFALLGLEWFGPNSYLSLAMAGTGGYLGVEGMTYIVSYFTKTLRQDK